MFSVVIHSVSLSVFFWSVTPHCSVTSHIASYFDVFAAILHRAFESSCDNSVTIPLHRITCTPCFVCVMHGRVCLRHGGCEIINDGWRFCSWALKCACHVEEQRFQIQGLHRRVRNLVSRCSSGSAVVSTGVASSLFPRSRSNRDRSGICRDNSYFSDPSTFTSFSSFLRPQLHYRQQHSSFCSASWSIQAISTASWTMIPVTLPVSTGCSVRATRHHSTVLGQVVGSGNLSILISLPIIPDWIHRYCTLLWSAPSAQAISVGHFNCCVGARFHNFCRDEAKVFCHAGSRHRSAPPLSSCFSGAQRQVQFATLTKLLQSPLRITTPALLD